MLFLLSTLGDEGSLCVEDGICVNVLDRFSTNKFTQILAG